MRNALLIPVLIIMPTVGYADDNTVPWHATWMLEAVGIVVALLIATLLWLFRRIMASFIGATVLITAVFFVLLAFFGRAVGVYDAFLGTTYAYPYRSQDLPPTPADPVDIRQGGYPHMPQHDEQDGIEPFDDSAPSFEEFFQSTDE